MIELNEEEIRARRVERSELMEQVKKINARLAVISWEILAGCSKPAPNPRGRPRKKPPAEQMGLLDGAQLPPPPSPRTAADRTVPLPFDDAGDKREAPSISAGSSPDLPRSVRDRVLARLERSKKHRSSKVLATLEGLPLEDVEDALGQLSRAGLLAPYQGPGANGEGWILKSKITAPLPHQLPTESPAAKVPEVPEVHKAPGAPFKRVRGRKDGSAVRPFAELFEAVTAAAVENDAAFFPELQKSFPRVHREVLWSILHALCEAGVLGKTGPEKYEPCTVIKDTKELQGRVERWFLVLLMDREASSLPPATAAELERLTELEAPVVAHLAARLEAQNKITTRAGALELVSTKKNSKKKGGKK
jgi:hypothetical protein